MKKQLAILFIALGLCFNAQSQTLLANFPLSSNGNDISGHGYTMVIHNGTFSNGGVYFDGVYPGSYASINSITGFTNTAPFSVMAEFMIDGVYANSSGTYPVFLAGSSYRWMSFAVKSDGTTMKAVLLTNNSTTTLSTKVINPNQWYSAKVNFDGTTVTLHVDQQIECSLATTLTAGSDHDLLTKNPGNGKCLKGWIKNFKVYDAPVQDTVYANDAAMQMITTPAVNLVGNTNIRGVLVNNGTNNITAYSVTYRIDGGTMSPADSITGINLAHGDTMSFTHTVPANLASGNHTIEVTIASVNGITDDNPNDNVLSKDVKSIYAIDATAVSIDNDQYVLAGNISLTGTLKNSGFNAITSYDVAYIVDGGAPSAVFAVTGQNIPFDSSGHFIHNVPAALAMGQHSISVTVSNINAGADANPSDNTITGSIIALSSSPLKRVFGEEATGTWCGFCVRGIVYMDTMDIKYPDTWVGVAVHGGDPMEDAVYSNGLNATGFPSAKIDRVGGFTDPKKFEANYLARITKHAPVDVSISNISYNSATRLISYDVNAIPAATITVDWRMNGVIYENDVTWNSPSDSTNYQQHNYYAGGGLGPMGGFESMPSIISAAYMHYDHVGRTILGGFDGSAGSFPSSVTDGSSYTKTYTYTLPALMDAAQIQLVGLVIDHANGEILNVVKAPLSGLDVNEYANGDKYIYPNPTTGILHLSGKPFDRVEVYNLYGQLMISENNTDQIDISAFANGIYLIKAGNSQNTITSKIILRK
jgi:hypothetical protein